MFFELFLLSAIVVTAYLGLMILRRGGPETRVYGWMLMADLLLALVAFTSRRVEGPSPPGDLLGFVALGGAVCLVMVPPLLRDMARRALLSDRLRLAAVLVDLRELLQPGMGADREREFIDAVLAVRSGKVDEAVEVLRQRRLAVAEPAVRRQIDERIVMTFLYARRWTEAILHFEHHLEVTGYMSPQLVVEMVRAYCETDDLERAAELVERLENSPLAEEPSLAFLLHRARMVFLAFVGRTTAVEAIVAPSGPLGAMPEFARSFWSGVARMNAGDPTGARNSLSRAVHLSARESRWGQLAEELLSTVDQVAAVRPRVVTPPVAELADRLTTLSTSAASASQARMAPRLTGVGIRTVPVTAALIAANVAVALVFHLAFGSSNDLGGLVRAGANVKSAVAAGEWWRLGASMYLHVGVLHLVLNMYGLWVLGKLVEQLYGSPRFFAIYSSAGLLGAAASFLFGPPSLSAGASGAVFGLLGAAVTELALYRRRYPQGWRNALLGNLVFLTVAQVLIGFGYPAIDQSAHLGGLVGGGLLAAVLSPHGRFAARLPVRLLLGLLVLGNAAAVVYSAVGVATTSYSDTLARHGWAERTLRHFRVAAPSSWVAEQQQLMDPGLPLSLDLLRVAASGDVDEFLARHLEENQNARLGGQFDRVERTTQNLLSLPEPWRGRELRAETKLIGGDTQYFRAVVFARAVAGEMWFGVLLAPETLVDALGPVVARILDSARPVGPPLELGVPEGKPAAPVP